MTGYGRLIAELGAAAARRDAALAAADRAYDEGVAAASAELARAAADARAADRRAVADTEAVRRVDREAARLWAELRALRRWPGRRVGDLPEPDGSAGEPVAWAGPGGEPTAWAGAGGVFPGGTGPSGAGPSGAGPSGAGPSGAGPSGAGPSGAGGFGQGLDGVGGSGGAGRSDDGLSPAARALERAGRRIAAAHPGAPRSPVPRLVLPFLPVVGAALAALTGLVAAGLVAAAPDGATSLPRVLGWLVFLVAPFSAIPPVAVWLRQMGSRLDGGATGLLLLGGMAAGTILSLTLTR
ncbi:hypothetical protein AB0I61_11590 [Polymorphospora rubra]|uniref:hypothetical protein n=1 Tax=Polymorphospora rubra TaxID=338584 RepID=UPI0033F86BE9